MKSFDKEAVLLSKIIFFMLNNCKLLESKKITSTFSREFFFLILQNEKSCLIIKSIDIVEVDDLEK